MPGTGLSIIHSWVHSPLIAGWGDDFSLFYLWDAERLTNLYNNAQLTDRTGVWTQDSLIQLLELEWNRGVEPELRAKSKMQCSSRSYLDGYLLISYLTISPYIYCILFYFSMNVHLHFFFSFSWEEMIFTHDIPSLKFTRCKIIFYTQNNSFFIRV